MKNSILFVLAIHAFASVFGQKAELAQPRPVDGQILVQTLPTASIENLGQQLEAAFPHESTGGVRFSFKEIAPAMHVWLISFDENFIKKEDLLAAALRAPGVTAAQLDYPLDERTTEPNDPQFFKQTDFDLIRATQAWDAATGGTTPQGDTIVVAILEKGIWRDHPDLRENMWLNNHEIPDNGLDDDENGYIDDFRGWDVRDSNDGPGTVGPHGTSVSGIIGAHGDNSEGVSGINWNVKMMPVVNCSLTSEIVAGYNYVLIQRQLYNLTGGQRGAFVVATNASFGISGLFPASQPIWCAMYDSLGRAGVVSVGATDNANVNVDIAGDLPSTCPSEFLIVVTNVGQNDVKVNGAAFGATNVDIGAPGEACWTTDFRVPTPPSTDTVKYNAFPGTSAATPHVTGTIGWMYSVPCAQLADDAKTDPTACARRMRDLVLKNTAQLSSLKDITTTAGRLDMLNILAAIQDLCGSAAGKLGIEEISIDPSWEKIKVKYQTPDTHQYTVQLVDKLGRVLRQSKIRPDNFLPKEFEFNEIRTLANGVYTVVIFDRNGKAARQFWKVTN